MLRERMSQLRDHKCKHKFQDPLNPIWSCGFDIESTSHFLLHCLTFNDERYNLLSNLNNIDCKLLEITKYSLSQTLLYGNTLFDKEKTHTLLTQQLNIFYLLKDSRCLSFTKFPSESRISFLPEVFLNALLHLFPMLILSHTFLFIFIPTRFTILVHGDCHF